MVKLWWLLLGHLTVGSWTLNPFILVRIQAQQQRHSLLLTTVLKLTIMWYNSTMSEVRKTALINAIATALYIIAVGSFMYYGSLVKLGRVNTMLAPITLLLLFVFSAALTGSLLFGKPAQMYVDGKKKEALSLLTYTLTFFSIITFIAIVLLIAFTR